MRIKLQLSLLVGLLAANLTGAPVQTAYSAETPEAIPHALPIDVPVRKWLPTEGKANAAMVCVHGLGLNSRSYDDFATRMAGRQLAVYALDVRGFGEWMDAKGHTKIDFKKSLADIQAVLKAVRAEHPGLPVFLVGESMGGALALRATALNPELISGLISAVPANERFQQTSGEIDIALRAAVVGPGKDFKEGVKVVDQATKNKDERKAWESDPLDRMELSPLDLLQFQELCDKNHDSAKKILTTPVLVLQGCEDHLIKPSGTFNLFNHISSKDKVMMLLGDREHLILELEEYSNPQSTVDAVYSWLDHHRNAVTASTPSAADQQASD